ncbi:MAG: hypothetical protein PHY02_11040 [Phycisphaerae bacterium]|nr:hypothetical protein [Phycisphaerae bacterium]
MKVLLSICRWWQELWGRDADLHCGIDSHKWESKIEAYRGFSRSY